MEALFQIIGQVLNYIVKNVNEALNADVKHRVFLKEGEIIGAISQNVQAQYGALEDALGQAAVTQYQTELEEETRAKILKGNLISVGAVVFFLLLIFAAFYVIKKK